MSSIQLAIGASRIDAMMATPTTVRMKVRSILFLLLVEFEDRIKPNRGHIVVIVPPNRTIIYLDTPRPVKYEGTVPSVHAQPPTAA